jgi:hypothetical protein
MEDILNAIMNSMDERPLLYIILCLILAIGLLVYGIIRKLSNN